MLTREEEVVVDGGLVCGVDLGVVMRAFHLRKSYFSELQSLPMVKTQSFSSIKVLRA